MLSPVYAVAVVIAGLLFTLTPGVTAPAEALSATKVARVLTVAKNQQGTPYVWGGTSRRGFDCSGYTQFVFRKAGKRLPRTADQQFHATKRVSRKAARRGDLVFFHSGSKRGHVYHVGIFAGRGKIWHAPSTGKRVHKAPIWTWHGVTFGRVR